MLTKFRDRLAKRWVIACAMLLAAGAHAQEYPVKPARIIVAFSPGAATDLIARAAAQRYSEVFGQNFIVENRAAGGGGTVGTAQAAKALADGYTLLMGNNSTHSVAPHIYKNAGYDALRDFAPISLAGLIPMVLVVHPALPVTDLKGLIALARARPGQLLFSSSGTGTTLHLAGELFKSMAKIDIVHIPYKGGAPQIAALLGGEIQSSMDVYATSYVHVRSGKFKVLGVASAKRFSLTPDVPTLGEQGFPVEGGTFFALLGPAKLPPEIVATLNRAINTVLDMPDVRERLAAIGVEQVGGSSEVLASTIRNELQKWARLVQSRNLKFD